MPGYLRTKNPGRVPGKSMPLYNFSGLTPTLTMKPSIGFGASQYANAYGLQRQNTWIAAWQKKSLNQYLAREKSDLIYNITWNRS